VLIAASGASTYSWSTGSTATSIVVTPAATTVYTCTGFVGACSSIKTTTVTVGVIPAIPIITQAGAVLSSSSPTGNQWYLNGSIIPGATGQTYTVTSEGYYSVTVTSSLGCQSSSSSLHVTFAGLNELSIYNAISVGPNPAKTAISLSIPNELLNNNASVKIIDVNGKVVFYKQMLLNNTSEKINVENFANGIYVVEFKAQNIDKKIKFVKE
jgi:hypothetical protein